MRRFELVEPRTFPDACRLLSESEEARPIADGTALLTLIKHGIFIPKTLVNLKKIPGADGISYDTQNGLRIGALASIYAVETSALVVRHYPVLSRACHVVANIRIRNMATLGGNLAHGDYQSDPPTVLVALDAAVELTSQRATRQVKLCDFLLGSYETALEVGELISALVIPPPPAGLGGTYIKFTTGSSEERPCVGVAAMTRMDGEICRELRLVVGAVSPRPVRMMIGERMAQGEKLSPKLIANIAAQSSSDVDPLDDLRGSTEYKRHVVGVLVRRALAGCAAS
jgi:aerobic carbon-monoxide dehydrogenase medium subunit